MPKGPVNPRLQSRSAVGKGQKNLGGRPFFNPTEKQRGEVWAYSIVGVPHHTQAKLLGIDTKTLLKHFPKELTLGKERANATVARRLFNQTEKNVAAAIFWMKAQCGWRETMALQHGGLPGAPPIATAQLAGDITDEQAMAAYLRMVKGGG